MHRCLLTLTVAFAALAAAAEPADPLKSPACEQALQRLQVQEAQAASAPGAGPRADGRPRTPDARVQALRRRAAQVCLGSRADAPPPPARGAQPPVAVPSVAIPPVSVAPVPVPSVAVPRVTVPPVTVPPVTVPSVTVPTPQAQAPTVITSCDPTGCWASDGTRLNRMGQNLLGPRGLCTVQGTLLQCP